MVFIAMQVRLMTHFGRRLSLKIGHSFQRTASSAPALSIDSIEKKMINYCF